MSLLRNSFQNFECTPTDKEKKETNQIKSIYKVD